MRNTTEELLARVRDAGPGGLVLHQKEAAETLFDRCRLEMRGLINQIETGTHVHNFSVHMWAKSPARLD